MTELDEVRSRWASTLPSGEEDEAASGTARDRAVAVANSWREAHGIEPLATEEHPELELHERARALGLCR